MTFPSEAILAMMVYWYNQSRKPLEIFVFVALNLFQVPAGQPLEGLQAGC
jgi:hypothetical protein